MLTSVFIIFNFSSLFLRSQILQLTFSTCFFFFLHTYNVVAGRLSAFRALCQQLNSLPRSRNLRLNKSVTSKKMSLSYADLITSNVPNNIFNRFTSVSVEYCILQYNFSLGAKNNNSAVKFTIKQELTLQVTVV